MINNFEEVKRQLSELSDVLNKFKSETVQLKIVELIFRNAGLDEEEESGPDPIKPSGAKRKHGRKAPKSDSKASNEKKRAGGAGAVSTLDTLIGDGYFKQARTIGEIVNYCKDDLVRMFKANDLSGPLGRFVREKKLSRSKNADGQFQYVKK